MDRRRGSACAAARAVTAATSLILVRVADRRFARRFLAGAGEPRGERHRGVALRVYRTLAAAFVGKFLAVGSPAQRARGDRRDAPPVARAPAALPPGAVDKLDSGGPARAMRTRRSVASHRWYAGSEGWSARSARSSTRRAWKARPRRCARRATGSGSTSRRCMRRGRRSGQFRPTLPQEVPAGTSPSWAPSGSTACSTSSQRISGAQGAALPGLVRRLRRQLGRSGRSRAGESRWRRCSAASRRCS